MSAQISLDQQLQATASQGTSDPYFIFAAVIPAIFLVLLLVVATVPYIANRPWSAVLPSWTQIIAHDVVSDDDLRRLDQELEKARQLELAQLTPAQRIEQERGAVDANHLSTAGSQNGHSRLHLVEEDAPLLPAKTKEQLVGKPYPPTAYLWVSMALAAIAVLQLLAWVTLSAFHLADEVVDATEALIPTAQIAVWLYAAIRPVFHRQRTPPYDLFSLYLAQALASVIGLHAILAPADHRWSLFTHSTAIAHAASLLGSALALTLIVGLPLTEDPDFSTVDALGRPSAAEDRCNLWEWITFSWVTPLIDVANARTLEKDDIWQLSKSCRSSVVLRVLKQAKASSLVRRIIRANAHDILLDLFLTFVASALSYASPYFLKQILQAIQASNDPRASPNAPSKSTAYLLAIISLVAMITKSQADLQHLFYGRRGGIRMRGQLISAVYEKALRTRDMNGVLAPQDDSANASEAGNDQSGPKEQARQAKATQELNVSNDASIGKIVSLAAVDSIRISVFCSGAYMLYSAPIELVVATLFLYRLLGWSAFTGIIVVIFAVPLQSYLTRLSIWVSKQQSAARDQRLSSLNELVQNLKFIKFYALEEEMQRRVLKLRELELSWLRKRQLLQSVNTALWTLTPALVTTVAFASYVLLAKRDLDVATAFTSIALFGMLRGPLNTLPVMINDMLNAKVAVDRIQDFLNADEVAPNVSSLEVDEESAPDLQGSADGDFGCTEATFKWPSAPVSELTGAVSSKPDFSTLTRAAAKLFKKRQAEARTGEREPLLGHRDSTVSTGSLNGADGIPFELSNITFRPPPSKMTLVVGPTGSGKSALLNALLGELELVAGESHLYKSGSIDPETGLSDTIGYCAQSPWLQHSSIRNNILFGSPMEPQRYSTVLEVCALLPDLEILDGDGTEIGEKGVSLSGGQQARVALARAVYSRSKTLLLDDPLSAVDAHTAAKLVDECLCGPLMQGRTVVLVTHHAELILGTEAASHVVKMSNGTIVAQGSPEELRRAGELEYSDKHANTLKDAQPDGTQKQKASVDEGGAQQKGGENAPRRLVEEEKRAKGGIKREVYILYLRALGYRFAAATLVFLAAFKGMDLAEKGWLAYWGASYQTREEAVHTSAAGSNVSTSQHDYVWAVDSSSGPSLFWQAGLPHLHLAAFAPDFEVTTASLLPPADQSPLPYILVFFLIQLLSATAMIAAALCSYYGSMKASRSLFTRMLSATMGATSRWLDKTPSGRIVNRFSRDVEVVDSSINNTLRNFALFVISGIISVLTIVVVLPSFIIPTLILGVMNYYVARGYIRAARDLRRHESVSRSPIFSAFSELLQGIATVRSFAAEKRMLRECTDRIDLANSFYLYFWMANRWLLFRLDVLGALAIFCATIASLYGGVAAGIAGLALTQSQGIVQSMYWLSRTYTTVEQDANSIERVREGVDEVPQEPAAVVESNRPPADWPAKGKVEVKDLVLRYAPDLPPVLHGISFTVQPGEKVGIVGRTGSGKSTTALAFFRFVEFDSGSIVIDGVDIGKIGLQDLRSRLTIIPQNAVLFSGTIRDNLDPYAKHSDEECIRALHAVNIRTTPAASRAVSRAASRPVSRIGSVKGLSKMSASTSLRPPTNHDNGDPVPGDEAAMGSEEDDSGAASGQTFLTLSTRVSEGGSNFSSGQRQLLSIARALLRNTQVILLDEASSSVDFSTDALIQSTIRHGFAHATVITIAHRLRTVVASDKVLVLDQGKVKEFGSPLELLDRGEGGAFWGMCKKSGDFDVLKREAEEREEEKRRSG